MENKPIGGYFGWEFPIKQYSFPHEEGLLLNNSRSALQVIIQSLDDVEKVFVPYYTCDSVALALDAIGVNYEFYHINKDLELGDCITLQPNEYLIYVNYFGVKDEYCKQLSTIYGTHLIIDNAQALYASHIDGTHSTYSIRKFVGVPDGGVAVSSALKVADNYQPSSAMDRCGALLARAEGDIDTGFQRFHSNDAQFKQDGIKGISEISKHILHSLDHDVIVAQRRSNYRVLHNALKSYNSFSLPPEDSFACPMVYPFYAEDESLLTKLIENKIFVARYWPNVLKWCKEDTIENDLCRHILPLPIDQRYDKNDMQRIIETIKNHLSWSQEYT